MKDQEKKYPVTKFDFDKRALSYSTLKHMLKSPLHFSHNWFEKKALTPAMMFGRLVDCLLLEPEKFAKDFVVKPKFTGTGSRKALAEWTEANQGKTHVTEDQIEDAKKIVENIKTNPKTSWLFNATTEVQKKIVYKDKKTGLKVIMYLDGVSEREGKTVIWDLKTTTDASRDAYERQAAKMEYHLQAGTYVNGMIRKTGQFCDFYQIVAENKPPFAVNCFRASDDFVKIGKDQFRIAIDRVAHCIENDCFDQGFDYLDQVGFTELDLPVYIKRKLED